VSPRYSSRPAVTAIESGAAAQRPWLGVRSWPLASARVRRGLAGGGRQEPTSNAQSGGLYRPRPPTGGRSAWRELTGQATPSIPCTYLGSPRTFVSRNPSEPIRPRAPLLLRWAPIRSVVVRYLDAVGIAAIPSKADSPLIVDADAPVAFPVTMQLLQSVRGRYPQEIECVRCIQGWQLGIGAAMNIGRPPAHTTPGKDDGSTSAPLGVRR
jgi:hypothetical protein